MAQDYSELKLNKNLFNENSLALRKSDYISSSAQDIRFEKGPFAPPTLISQGTLTVQGSFTAPTISVGTLNNAAITGTSRQTGTLTNTGVITGGFINAGTSDNVVMGTPTINSPAVTGGTFTTPLINNGTLGTPTLQTPTIDGTANFDTNAGSAALSIDGDFAIQTFGTGGILVFRVNGTTFRITASGTL